MFVHDKLLEARPYALLQAADVGRADADVDFVQIGVLALDDNALDVYVIVGRLSPALRFLHSAPLKQCTAASKPVNRRWFS